MSLSKRYFLQRQEKNMSQYIQSDLKAYIQRFLQPSQHCAYSDTINDRSVNTSLVLNFLKVRNLPRHLNLAGSSLRDFRYGRMGKGFAIICTLHHMWCVSVKKKKCSLQLILEDKHLCYSRVLIIKYGWQFRFPETFLNNRFTSEPVLCAFRLWNWNIEKNLLTRMLPENCCRILAADLKNSCKLLPWILSIIAWQEQVKKGNFVSY